MDPNFKVSLLKLKNSIIRLPVIATNDIDDSYIQNSP